jgi:23S rRNA pseudouridine955/2504/2580 synthase
MYLALPGLSRIDVKRITVIFENDECIVLDKPAGLAVQGGEGVGASLDKLLAEEWAVRPLLVHRLDKDTSGLILAAKNREAAAKFSALFGGGNAGMSGRGIVKQYLAVCSGRPKDDSGIIRLDLDIRGSIKKSETAFAMKSQKGDFSLLELELGTGRMHQIRRHLAQIGNPVLGDDKYGDFALNKDLRKTAGLRRLLLHSARLCIPEALAGFPGGIDVSAPLPEYFFPFTIA